MRPSIVQCISKVSAVVIVVFSLVDIVQAGPARPLYLSTGSQIQVLQFNSIIDSWTTGEQEFSIAVDMTVRTWSQGNQFLSLLGKEYLLDGTPTGATYANDVGCCFRDGTTDGQFNYAIRQVAAAANSIYRFNLDWTNPQVMPVNPIYGPGLLSGVTGITYDSSDDTFWLAGGNDFLFVEHITRAGNLISSFGGGTGSMASLAYDAADDTLWLYSARPGLSTLSHYAASDDMTHANFPITSEPGIGFVTGIEFQLQHLAPVPEPATVVLLAAGLAIVLSVSARKRNRRS